MGFLDGGNLFPGGDDTLRAGREVVADEPVELGEFVAGDGGVHVVFGVEVHVPIEEADDRVEGEGAATEAEVGDVVLEADVLGVVADEEKPVAVEHGERCEDREEPELEGERDDEDQGVADEECSRPVDGRAAFVR